MTKPVHQIMIPLKDDGSLDVERINNFSIEEYTKVIKLFTPKQRECYYSYNSVIGTHRQTVGVKFCPVDEVIKMGLGVNADDFLNKMRKKYLTK